MKCFSLFVLCLETGGIARMESLRVPVSYYMDEIGINKSFYDLPHTHTHAHTLSLSLSLSLSLCLSVFLSFFLSWYFLFFLPAMGNNPFYLPLPLFLILLFIFSCFCHRLGGGWWSYKCCSISSPSISCYLSLSLSLPLRYMIGRRIPCVPFLGYTIKRSLSIPRAYGKKSRSICFSFVFPSSHQTIANTTKYDFYEVSTIFISRCCKTN